jgi:hypothetical protein
VIRLRWTESVGSIAMLAVSVSCHSTVDNDLERADSRTSSLQAAARAENAQQDGLANQVSELRKEVDGLLVDGRAVQESYRNAQQQFEAAESSLSRSSAAFRQAEREYKLAADQYRLVAFVLSNAGHGHGLSDLVCNELSTSAHAAAGQIVDQLPLPDLPELPVDVPFVNQLAKSKAFRGPEQLRAMLETRIGVSALRRLDALPEKEVDRLFDAGLRALGCR